jgi:hypothetical protein
VTDTKVIKLAQPGRSRRKSLTPWGDIPIIRPRRATSASCVTGICPSVRS